MRGTFLCSIFLGFSFLAGQAPPAGPREHEIQFRRNDYTAVPTASRLRAASLTKALLRVFSDDEERGGLYFDNGSFPVVRPALQQWLGEYAGKEVPLWAWMGARKFVWLKDAGLLDRDWSNGRVRLIPKLDLFNPQAQELIVTMFARLAGQAIKGILIQDDLTLLRHEGFSSWGKASFTQQGGLDAEPRRMLAAGSAHNRIWQDVKVRRVVETLGKIIVACRNVNPDVQIGLNVHYEAPLTPERARSWYAFDLPATTAAGVDLFYLMAYHRQMRAEMKLWEGDNRLYFRRMLEAALRLWGPKLVVKLQVRDWKSSEPIPFAELKTYYDLIPSGVERVCFAAADPEDLDLISKVIAK